MRGENRMELQAREQLGCFGSAHLIGELMERHGEGVRRVDGVLGGDAALTLAQDTHAIALLGEVRQVEKRREGAYDDLSLVDGQCVDEGDGVAEGAGGGRLPRGHALLVNILAIGLGTGIAGVRANDAHHELIEYIEHLSVVLAQDAALEAQEQRQVVAELGGDVDVGQNLDRRLKVGQVDTTGARHDISDHVTGERFAQALASLRILCHTTSFIA